MRDSKHYEEIVLRSVPVWTPSGYVSGQVQAMMVEIVSEKQQAPIRMGAGLEDQREEKSEE